MEQTYDQIVTNTVETEILNQPDNYTAANGYALPNWKEKNDGTAINGN